MKYKPYKKGDGHTYALGASPTIEILRMNPGMVHQVYVHSDYRRTSELVEICRENGIPLMREDYLFERLSPKENCYVISVITPMPHELRSDLPHVVLVNPSDMGNLGTIVRTMAGLNYLDLAIITPAADICNPKTIRASMGAIAPMHWTEYPSFNDYREEFPGHTLYPFMLTVEPAVPSEPARPFSLIFGNEGSGLDPSFAASGSPVRLRQSGLVDSLNLSIAAGIGMYLFSCF